VLVRVIYALGLLAIVLPVLVGVVIVAAAYFSDLTFGVYISPLTILVWSGVVLLAAVTMLSRRFGARQ
jgi:hypothetical protein